MPTTTVGSSTSVFDVHHRAVSLTLRGRADDGADRLGRAAPAADHLAHVVRGDANAVPRSTVVERLLDGDGVGFIDQLLDEELDEVLHDPSGVSAAGGSSVGVSTALVSPAASSADPSTASTASAASASAIAGSPSIAWGSSAGGVSGCAAAASAFAFAFLE